MKAIYAIKNTINNKLYIGSALCIQSRWNRHKSDLSLNRHHSRHLQRAWVKYGSDKFQFFILEEVEDESLLVIREQYFIDLNKTANPSYGYNICPTAGSSLGVKHSKETCEIFSKVQIERYKNREERLKTGEQSKLSWNKEGRKKQASEAMKMRWSNPKEVALQSQRMKNICSTEEHRNKLSDGHIRYFADPANRLKKLEEIPHKKSVICVETNQVFASINQAAKSLGVSIVKIRDSANGKRKSRGFSFRWI